MDLNNPVKQQQNIFFEKIKTDLKERIENNTIQKDLERICSAYMADENAKLSQKDYTLLGMMAYITGLDYTSQVGGLTAPVVLNVCRRFSDLDMPTPAIDLFFGIIKHMNPLTLEEPKDLTTTMVENVVPLPADRMMEIRTAISTILNNTSYPVIFAKDINELKKKKFSTYQDFLKLNSMIYEQIEMPGKYIKMMNKLYNNRDFQNLLNEGSNYFDLSKFALIYYDSIFSLKEFQAVHGYPSILDYYDDPAMISEGPLALPEKHVLPQTEHVMPEVINKPKYNPGIIDQQDSDRFIKGVLEESGEEQIVSGDSFMRCLASIIRNEKLGPDFYKFLKANANVRRSDGIKVWGTVFEEIKDILQIDIEAQKEFYKELVIRYTEEIPANYSQRIINYVNELIMSLVIQGGERKSVFMQQIAANQISTYKHLHQTINLIEECNIEGSKTSAYVDLHDYLLNHDYPFVKLFEEVQQIDSIQLKLSIYGGMLDFLNVEVTEENSFDTYKQGRPEYTEKATGETVESAEATVKHMHHKK
jgi:hypothetical protein